MLAVSAYEPEFVPRTLVFKKRKKKVAYACDIRAGDAEAGGSLGLTGQLA